MSTGSLTNTEQGNGTALMRRNPGTALLNRTLVFDHFKDEVNRLFEDFGMAFDIGMPKPSDTTSEHLVKIDLQDNGDELILLAEVPGVELNDMTLAVTPHYVSLSGEKREETGRHVGDYYRMERNHGFFRRVIAMPCEIDKECIDAEYKDGILRISLPKTKAAINEEKKIVVKSG